MELRTAVYSDMVYRLIYKLRGTVYVTSIRHRNMLTHDKKKFFWKSGIPIYFCTLIVFTFSIHYTYTNKKGKVIPLQARCGPEGG